MFCHECDAHTCMTCAAWPWAMTEPLLDSDGGSFPTAPVESMSTVSQTPVIGAVLCQCGAAASIRVTRVHTCTECCAQRPRNRTAWRCGVCRSLVCPACHRKTRHRLAAPALAHAPSQPRLRTGAASAEPDDLGDPQIVQSLVTLLIARPTVTPSSIPV